MLQTKAVLRRKEPEIEATDCVVDKVVRLSGAEFDRFSRNLMRGWDFLRETHIDPVVDKEGRTHCLLVTGEGRRDGILVKADAAEYARYSAFMPNAEDFLTVGRYSTLAELNKKLTAMVDYIAEQAGTGNPEGRGAVNLQDFEMAYGIDLMTNGALRGVVLDMLDERPEIKDWELDKNELIICRTSEAALAAEDLSDPSVTRTDMYAYGYGWDGMIPLGKDRALELYEKGREVFRLYEDNTEGAAESRDDIETFGGLFGTEDTTWIRPEQEQSLQVFILNREKYDKGETSGEWLALPAGADTLRGLFERVGVEKPSEGAFTITAIRVPEYIRGYVSKYDNLDELNMLASYMETAADSCELRKFQTILTSGNMDVGSSTAALINLLDSENLDGFELIDADDAESLARYYDRESNEKPDGVSFQQYGEECVKSEGGVFTEEGYLKFKYEDLLPLYTGVVPDEFKITGEALRGLLAKTSERGGQDEKPSVLKQIRDAQKASKPPRKEKKSSQKKEEEL